MIRVLVADDHPTVRAALETSLSLEADIRVVGGAADGPTCLRVAHEQRPDVVLLDLHMPEMNGFEVMRSLKTVLPAIRTVAFTGDDDQEDAALESGAFCVVTKGAPRDEILRAIRFAFHAGRRDGQRDEARSVFSSGSCGALLQRFAVRADR